MRIKTSSYITSLKGAIGGTIALKQNSTLFIRTKSKHSQKVSASTRLTQSYFATVTRLWNSLSDLDRASWDNPIQTHAQNFNDFVALNMFRLRVGMATSLIKPTRPQFPVTPQITGSFNSDSQNILLTVGTFSGTSRFQLRIDVSIPLQLSFSSYKKNYFYAGLFPCSDGSSIDISSFVLKSFGTIHTGTKYFIRYTLVDTQTGYHSQNFFTAIFESKSMTQHDVTSSRVNGTNYHNTTGSDIFVCAGSALNVGHDITAFSDNTTTPTKIVSDYRGGSNYTVSVFFVVPAGAYYRIEAPSSGTNLRYWLEYY